MLAVAALLIFMLFVVAFIVYMERAQRRILVQYPKRQQGNRMFGGESSFLPHGIAGIFPALPFAIWFYLAIEEVPLAAEESMDPKRDVPKGTIWGMHTLLIASILTLVLNSGVDGGAAVIGVSGTPLFDGFRGVFGDGFAASSSSMGDEDFMAALSRAKTSSCVITSSLTTAAIRRRTRRCRIANIRSFG